MSSEGAASKAAGVTTGVGAAISAVVGACAAEGAVGGGKGTAGGVLAAGGGTGGGSVLSFACSGGTSPEGAVSGSASEVAIDSPEVQTGMAKIAHARWGRQDFVRTDLGPRSPVRVSLYSATSTVSPESAWRWRSHQLPQSERHTSAGPAIADQGKSQSISCADRMRSPAQLYLVLNASIHSGEPVALRRQLALHALSDSRGELTFRRPLTTRFILNTQGDKSPNLYTLQHHGLTDKLVDTVSRH